MQTMFRVAPHGNAVRKRADSASPLHNGPSCYLMHSLAESAKDWGIQWTWEFWGLRRAANRPFSVC